MIISNTIPLLPPEYMVLIIETVISCFWGLECSVSGFGFGGWRLGLLVLASTTLLPVACGVYLDPRIIERRRIIKAILENRAMLKDLLITHVRLIEVVDGLGIASRYNNSWVAEFVRRVGLKATATGRSGSRLL